MSNRILYTCNNDGILTASDARTGTRHYRARVGGGGSFSASPVAADGRLYFANEDADVIVVHAGPKYEELAKNPMGEVIMRTPRSPPAPSSSALSGTSTASGTGG